MPVQINELVIRANVKEGAADKAEAKTSRGANNAGNIDIDEIIKECAALVMEIINNKNQR